MSSPSGEKHGKAKSKKSSSKSSKTLKGGKGDVNVDKFRGDGMNFKCKLLGVAEVDGPRGDTMCMEALKKLKVHQRQSGEHKMKILFNVSLMGIRILEEKTKNILFEHPVNKVSFITHDPEDKKIFSFISNAKCSGVDVGHMMYAIKCDKLAGMITSTLYELFQAVFKLRQEAALKQRKSLQEPQPTFQDNSTPPSLAGMANGPSGASNINDNNIYEEPSSSASPSVLSPDVKEDRNHENSHYQVPTPRPLPPAPYASPSHQTNSLPRPKENSEDSTPNQVVSSASEHFFSSSVFTQAEHTADNISESSFDVTRKGSVSSSISSTSETASHDSKSLELKSGSATATPPAIPRARHATNSSGVHAQSGLTLETTPIPEDEDHYETIPSSDYETIPPDLVPKETKKTALQPAATGFAFKESFNDDESFPFETEKKSNGQADLFATSDKPEPSLKKSDGSPPSSAAFGNDDFFSSAFDDKFCTGHVPTTDFPVDDPFAPTSNATSTDTRSGDLFASSDAFESAFGPAGTTACIASPENDQNGKETSAEKLEKPESNVFGGFDDAFGTPDISSAFETRESNSMEKNSNEKAKDELSWSNAFESSEQKELKIDNFPEVSWSAAFGESEEKKDEKDEQGNSEGTKVDFAFDDSFGAKFNKDRQDSGQQPDQIAAEPDISWTNAFDDKPQKEVTFSWDDAFSTVDDKDSKTDNKLSESDTMSFNEAFASTPFKPTNTKKDSEVKIDDGFPSFGGVLTPIKSNISQSETAEKKENITQEIAENQNEEEELVNKINSKSSEKDLMESDNKDSMEPNNEDSIDLGSKENEEASIEQISDKSSNKVTNKIIPKIIEPAKEEDSDVEDEPVRPIILPVLPSRNNEDKGSPTAPPPLPPRARAPLPTLPPRPQTCSSPIVGQIPPTPPRPGVAAASSKPGKRPPPALPPRIDLQTKGQPSSESRGLTSTHPTDPFNSSNNIKTEGKNSWEVQWPDEFSKDNEKQNDSSSKNSPDPFGDDFFTDFDFATATKPTENTPGNKPDNNVFNDPFVSKETGRDIYKVDFGGVDPFADFSSGGTSADPFASDGSHMFAAFSSTNDPFADSVDPFADKGTLGDPFDVSPKKDGNDKSMSFQLTKNSEDDDFADSFA